MIDKLKKMIPNPLSLVLKLYCLVWFFLILQVVLKITFGYWQPYVIPTEQLDRISNYLDHSFIRHIINAILYIINGLFMTLTGLMRFWFKNKKHTIIFFVSCIILCVMNFNDTLCNITPIISCILIPVLFDYKKIGWILLTFGLNFLFLWLSFLLEGFAISYDMPYVVSLFMHNDYNIMLILSYLTFNLIRIYRKRGDSNG